MDTPEKTLPEAPKRRGRGRPRINTEQPAHMLLGGAVRVYKRDGSARYWQCSAHFDGKKFRTSTKEESLELAKQFAEDWYLGLKGKKIAGVLITEKTFSDVADIFLKEYQTITEGQRSAKWARGHEVRIRVHLNPFFGDMNISDITAGRVQEYRVARMTPKEEKSPHAEDNRPHKAKAPARSTLHDEIVTLRQVLKTAIRHGWLTALPDLSAPYKSQGKVVHRPWFSPSEYKALYTETRAQTKVGRPQDIWNAEQLHDYVLFMGNTGLRPDEAGNLLHRDIQIIEDADTGDQILLIEVRGKRGVGYCKSTPNAVKPYTRILNRARPIPEKTGEEAREELRKNPVYPQPNDPVFPESNVKRFNRVLEKLNLKYDRDGIARTTYSLRHTYICMRLMEGADIYQIAKNCRTSVEMIERFYAAHISTTLDASAINVRKAKTDRVTKVISKKSISPHYQDDREDNAVDDDEDL